MKARSAEFDAAFNADSMHVKGKLVIEFGSNRHNDGQVTSASSTKVARRGIDSVRNDTTKFWAPEDAFNNLNHNSMKWLVCDQGAQVNKSDDGTGYRAIDVEDIDITYERGWWSAVRSDGAGNFASDEWIQSEFFEEDGVTPFGRSINKFTVYFTEGYSNVKSFTLQYKTSSNSWVNVAPMYTTTTNEYEVEFNTEDITIYGLKVLIHSTHGGNQFARVSEFQGYWIKDVSDYLISADVTEVREEYESSVPVGTMVANTLNIELDNTEQLFNTNNVDSIYTSYIGADNRVEFSIGIDVNQGFGTPNYEYLQMGEFWTDDWANDGSSMTASFSARDRSKFLQDDTLHWGRVWKDQTVKLAFTDILLHEGMHLSRIMIDESDLDKIPIMYLGDQTQIWSFFGELAFANQGVFGFDHNGDFYYHSYKRLYEAPYNSSVMSLNWDNRIIDGRLNTSVYTNKVKVTITPYELDSERLVSLWRPPSPTILSWAKLGADISASATTITVQQAPRQESSNLTDNGWPNKGGLLFLPEIVNGEVVGGELIRYATRTDSQFEGCERGYLSTPPTEWSAGQYIGEARYWEIDYDKSPAEDVRWPFVTAIDSIEKLDGEQAQAHIIHFSKNAFNAEFAIGNIVDYYTWLMGVGQTLRDIDDVEFESEVDFATAIAGVAAVADVGGEQITEETEVTASNQDFIRRYGKNELEVKNDWIQTKEHGERLAKAIIDEFSEPRQVIEFEVIPHPALVAPDRITITNYPQLSIQNTDFHIIGATYTYDGSLSGSIIVREVKNE